jgi:hypothetical protein
MQALGYERQAVRYNSLTAGAADCTGLSVCYSSVVVLRVCMFSLCVCGVLKEEKCHCTGWRVVFFGCEYELLVHVCFWQLTALNYLYDTMRALACVFGRPFCEHAVLCTHLVCFVLEFRTMEGAFCTHGFESEASLPLAHEMCCGLVRLVVFTWCLCA